MEEGAGGPEGEELALRLARLERERAALARRARSAERSLAARGRFLASLSHELRTPLHAILGYARLLAEGVYGPLAAPQAEAVGKIAGLAGQLLDLLGGALDFARIDAGRIEIRREPLDVARLAAEAVAAIEPLAREKGLDLATRCTGPFPPLESDPARIRQILLNLLSNAVKFTPAGSITLEARHIPPSSPGPGTPPGRDGWIGLAVHDTGIGVPPERAADIFRPFVQLEAPGGSPGGSGLGLAIASRLARLLGGTLDLDSEVGVRSTFTLYLPCPAPRVAPRARGG